MEMVYERNKTAPAPRGPMRMTSIVDVPRDWTFIGHLCIGYPQAEDDTPVLEREGWEHRRPSAGSLIRR
jgi:5,6-dimethylbenzimidazole synthase